MQCAAQGGVVFLKQPDLLLHPLRSEPFHGKDFRPVEEIQKRLC